jgi:serine protease Do
MKKIDGSLLVLSSILIVLLLYSQAVSAQGVKDIAQRTTVLINASEKGSGVIVWRQDNTYYILTARHVVERDTKNYFEIITFDQSRYPVKNIRYLRGEIDLAVLEFESSRYVYDTIEIDDSSKLEETSQIWVAGFPDPGVRFRSRVFQIFPGSITTISPLPTSQGYRIGYDNKTRTGMSGGPVIDSDGRLVGIHSGTEGEIRSKKPIQGWINVGIPINIFLEEVKKSGILPDLSEPPIVCNFSRCN